LGCSALTQLCEDFEQRPEVSTYQLHGLIDTFFATSRFRNLQLDVLRLDKVHPFISGNKWYKLKHHLLAANASEYSSVLSFGGPYSNHLHALAYAGHHFGFDTIGLVRGQAPDDDKLSPTLQDCQRWGMKLQWVNRQDYRRYATAEHNAPVQALYPEAYIIPEGGEGALGVQGVRELMERYIDELDEAYDIILTPVGSGTTLAGVIAASPVGQRVVGVSALKGAKDLEARTAASLTSLSADKIEIWHDYHQGGFAKMTPLLQNFISVIQQDYGLLLDPVYTGKALYALAHKFAHHKLGDNVRALMIHTGGLQGWRGYRSSGMSDS